MKPLDSYGPALVAYEGVADVAFPQDSGIVYKGYFEAKQLRAGGIAIGFMPIVHDAGDATSFTGHFYSEPSFKGRDLDGWEITTCGQTLGLPIVGPLGAPNDRVHPVSIFSSQCMKTKSRWASDSGYGQARFRLANLLWHDIDKIAEPISLETGALAVTVSPSDDYLKVADSITTVRGTAPTAEVLLRTVDESKQSLEEYGNFMDDLVSVFRLATGNKVDWYYGEALEVGTERCVERFHKDAITGPFSNTIKFRPLRRGAVSCIPKLNFKELAESFLADGKQVLDRNILKELTNYFINACDETSFLEARGLLASTLFDLIVLKYAQTTKAHVFMEEKGFKKQVFPFLKQTIKSAFLPNSSKELQTRAIEQLRGSIRQSFRKRLEVLNEGLDLRFEDQICESAVKIRNKLVHEGTYLQDEDWYSQYRFMIWMDLVALCRLTGYEGELPLLLEGRPLIV